MGIKDTVCKTKYTAISILETIRGKAESVTQRAAMAAVIEWMDKSHFDPNLTPGETEARINEILIHLRDCMSAQERREQAAFYLEGIEKLEAYDQALGVKS